MMKCARIAVDCCGEIRRIIWPLKADFQCQREGISKQYTEEAFILTQVGLVFFQPQRNTNFRRFRIGGLLGTLSNQEGNASQNVILYDTNEYSFPHRV